MISLRKTRLLNFFCYLMVISILAVSCDPHGSSAIDNQIEAQASKILEEYSSTMSSEDCTIFIDNVNKVKTYIWQLRQKGYNPSQKDIAKYVYDISVSQGKIEYNEENKEKFSNLIANNSLLGDPIKLIKNLEETAIFSNGMSSILENFTEEFKEVTTVEEGFSIISNFRNSKDLKLLNANEIIAFESSLNAAENGLCFELEKANMLDSREFWECVWELNWVRAIISVVVTVAVWILNVVLWGTGTLIATTISVAVWASVWSLSCAWAECEIPGPCPEGQQPFCQGEFALNLEEGLCELPDIYTGAIVSSANCIWVDFMQNGICPDGSTDVGNNQCLLQCFPNGLPEGFDFTTLSYPNECQ